MQTARLPRLTIRAAIAMAVAAVLWAPAPPTFAAPRAAGSLAPNPAVDPSLEPRPRDLIAARAAFEAIARNKWPDAEARARQARDPVVLKLVQWMGLVRGGAAAPFSGIAQFVDANPDWPALYLLRKRAEEAIDAKVPPRDVIEWFKRHSAVSGTGKARLGEALMAEGQQDAALAMIRDAWVNGDFPIKVEKAFYTRHRKWLTVEDHRRRLDRLVWEGKVTAARRVAWKADAEHRALAEARMMLRRQTGNVDRAIAKLPEALQDDPGLFYERVRWRRKKGKYLDAIELLKDSPPMAQYTRLWWAERSILARRALRNGHISDAYKLAKNHGFKSGADYADAEWTAGWIALRFLKDHKEATDHFLRMFEAVNYPVSRSRGAYWLGRAAEAAGDAKQAKFWFDTAAAFNTSYYGQLAAGRLGKTTAIALPTKPEIPPDKKAAFDKHELTRAVRLLARIGDKAADRELRPFAMRLADVRETPGWRDMAAALALEAGRPDLSIGVAKKSGRDGFELPHMAFPHVELPRVVKAAHASGASEVEPALIFAVVRQESAFHPEATSHAGARGLMQLMPATALNVAKSLKLPYSKDKLTEDPDYNIRLGHAYLRDMLQEFGGSYLLALSAYNAGPKRAKDWLKINGDPRASADEAIDWIEMIPFDETRNYVQRVLENLQVYRARLAPEEVASNLAEDLKR